MVGNSATRAGIARLKSQSKVEQDPEVVAMLEAVAACFRQLADTPALLVDFQFPREGLFDPFIPDLDWPGQKICRHLVDHEVYREPHHHEC